SEDHIAATRFASRSLYAATYASAFARIAASSSAWLALDDPGEDQNRPQATTIYKARFIFMATSLRQEKLVQHEESNYIPRRHFRCRRTERRRFENSPAWE